jgi:hypothetical protein
MERDPRAKDQAEREALHDVAEVMERHLPRLDPYSPVHVAFARLIPLLHRLGALRDGGHLRAL